MFLFPVETATRRELCVGPGVGAFVLGLVVGGVAGVVITLVVVWLIGRRKEARIHHTPKKKGVADTAGSIDLPPQKEKIAS